MNEFTRILQAIDDGDEAAGEELLPLAYRELRRIASHKMAAERSTHTLQATALVHEAYLRLLGPDGESPHWRSRGHFFKAAAEAMRRILIESARRRMAAKRGGGVARHTEFEESKAAARSAPPPEEIIAVDEALAKLEQDNELAGQVVKLRYFAGLSVDETAAALGISPSTVNRTWRGARAWLRIEIENSRS
jgi:RNA polymerase sigma factor (TIGR02999 family)